MVCTLAACRQSECSGTVPRFTRIAPAMLVNEIIAALERIAPPNLAADWDNVGLLVGSRAWKADDVLLTIDLTPAVMDEAVKAGAHMIVSYHPPIFQPIKSITDSTSAGRVLLRAMEERIAIYSPHTALDAAAGGLNDWLCEAFGPGDVRALQTHDALPETEQCKLVTFCPVEAVERVRNGLASSGAGRIGNYELCSFELTGRGTFLGGEGSNPVVGKRGSLEYVDEIRLEMVCSKVALALAITALKQFHPYEEPAFEIYPLLARPQRHVGQGRRIVLDRPLTLKAIVEQLKKHLGVRQLEVAEATDAPGKYECVGLCAGAGGSLLQDAIRQGCRLFFTGEMRHHDVLAAQAQGCTIILAGHTNTERGYLKPLRKQLMALVDGVDISIARRDEHPLQAM